MTAGRKHSASLVKTKQNPHGVPYPMSPPLLAPYSGEGSAILSKSPVEAQRLRKSNKKGRALRSVRPRTRQLDHACPLGYLGGDELGETFGRAALRLGAQREDGVAKLRCRQHLIDRSVELGNDRRRRAGRRHHAG